MIDLDLSDLTVFVTRVGDQLITDSRAVALAFRKQHKHVLRTIEAMLASTRPLIAKHARSNFGLCFYEVNGRQRPMYRMTQRGLNELAMSFTGDDAREIRIRFLEAFDLVQERLSQTKETLWDRMHGIDREESESIVKGRWGSKLMLERKREKPTYDEQRAVIAELMQPSLFALH